MGIPIPPGPPDFGDDCITCFPAGETPKTCWLIVSGAVKGRGWVIGMPETINGTFELTQLEFEACSWTYVIDKVGYQYQAAGVIIPPVGSQIKIIIRRPFVVDGFRGDNPFFCKRNFSNRLTEPPNKPFIGGTAMIFF